MQVRVWNASRAILASGMALLPPSLGEVDCSVTTTTTTSNVLDDGGMVVLGF